MTPEPPSRPMFPVVEVSVPPMVSRSVVEVDDEDMADNVRLPTARRVAPLLMVIGLWAVTLSPPSELMFPATTMPPTLSIESVPP